MYWWAYVLAIVVAVVVIVLFFVIKNNKDKQRIAKLTSTETQKSIEDSTVNKIQEDISVEEPVKENKDETVVQAIFEDYSLDPEESKQTKQEIVNRFTSFDENDDMIEDDDEFDAKFAEYEKFLKEALDKEANEQADDFDDLDDLSKVDFDRFEGKSTDEIAEMIKDLPKRMQELILTDVLAKRKYDDED